MDIDNFILKNKPQTIAGCGFCCKLVVLKLLFTMTNLQTKVCNKCKLEKPLNLFHKSAYLPTGCVGICKTCRSIKEKEKYKNRHNKETSQTIPSLDGEIWKDIQGFEGLYQISNFARVKSVAKTIKRKSGGALPFHERLKIPNTPQVYQRVPLHKNGKIYTISVHRLLAIHFIPNPNNYPVINHINGIKTDNRIENLEWCTHSHNTQHAYDMGLRKVGKDHYLSSMVRLPRKCRKVIDLSTGKIYQSAKECYKEKNIPRSNMYFFLLNSKGYKYAS